MNAFRYFGGVTATVLYDNLKSVVLFRDGDNVQWNPQFLAFSRAYGFKPILCAPGHAEGKGNASDCTPFQLSSSTSFEPGSLMLSFRRYVVGRRLIKALSPIIAGNSLE